MRCTGSPGGSRPRRRDTDAATPRLLLPPWLLSASYLQSLCRCAGLGRAPREGSQTRAEPSAPCCRVLPVLHRYGLLATYLVRFVGSGLSGCLAASYTSRDAASRGNLPWRHEAGCRKRKQGPAQSARRASAERLRCAIRPAPSGTAALASVRCRAVRLGGANIQDLVLLGPEPLTGRPSGAAQWLVDGRFQTQGYRRWPPSAYASRVLRGV